MINDVIAIFIEANTRVYPGAKLPLFFQCDIGKLLQM